MDVTDKVVRTVEDMLLYGCKMLPPDINHSETNFTPVDKNTVRYGLAAIKGVGEGVLEKILEERRSNGKFESLMDLCHRVGDSNVGRSVLEGLIRAGALDSLAPELKDPFDPEQFQKRWQGRATLVQNLELALSAANQQSKDCLLYTSPSPRD